METKTVIPVFFSIDDKYAPYLAVAIASLIDNASKKYDYNIIVLHKGVKAEYQRRIKALAREGFSIDFHSINSELRTISAEYAGNKLACLDRFTLTIFFRLFIPDMFPQYDKGIYLDSDTCVVGDISELYNIDLKDKYLAACPDWSIQEIKPFTDYVIKVVGVDRSLDYINSGILLMDLKTLREVQMGPRFLEINNKYHFDSVAPDQDYINAMCKGRIHYLDACWDAMPNNNHPAQKDPKIIHYNLFEKPWLHDGVQYEEYFWKYAPLSGFLEEINAFKASVTEESLAALRANGANMVKVAIELYSKDNNMADVFASGAEKRL